MWHNRFVLCVVAWLIYLTNHGSCLHLKGRWESHTFFKFLAKFGFQQTNMNDQQNTEGYIYGNITSSQNLTSGLYFVVVDSEYFLQYYGNRSLTPRNKACPAMFNKIQTIAWDSDCNTDGHEDFLRRIPCHKEQLCEDETTEWVIPGYQFTYRVRDKIQPRYWYVSMVSCYRETLNHSCSWGHNPTQDAVIDYDIWFVNGNPSVKHINPFEHQFSFDHHDTFEMYITFFLAYCCLIPIQLYALVKEKHMMPILLTMSMGMEFFGITFNFVHVCKFAFDGEGVDLLKVVGNFIDNLAQCIFMLLLLMIVKGWTITRRDLSSRSWFILFTVWGTYTAANLSLFIWNLMEIDQISDIGEWQTWPGWLILLFRIVIMVWFLFELRLTIQLERSKEKMRFYLHFGAGFLVWFVYLPIIAVICTQISSLWRYKTVLSVTYAADFLSYCVLVHLLWPSRSALYFNLKHETTIIMDDLEYTGSPSDSDYDTDDRCGLLQTRKHKTVHLNGRAYMSVPSIEEDSQDDETEHFSVLGAKFSEVSLETKTNSSGKPEPIDSGVDFTETKNGCSNW